MALVKLKTKEEAKLYKVKIGDPSKLKVGEKIYTISNPEGLKVLKATFSDGVVSGIREGDGKKLIQITAPISEGSSGGAVLNKKGKVVGISSLSLPDGQNLNFAYPIDLIRDVVKSRDIIYTFPNINAAWQFIGRIQKNDPFFVNSGIFDFYYDPNSIVTISETRKGFWCKKVPNQFPLLLYCFEEIDCNNNKIRTKARFSNAYYENDPNKLESESDFSKEGIWKEYSSVLPIAKIANTVCSSQ
jgi:hypothetical protein